MNRIKKVSRPVTCLLALLLCVMLLASTAFAAGGALGADRNGTPYTYVIGYMYSGSSQTINTREIFTSPNNYDICSAIWRGTSRGAIRRSSFGNRKNRHSTPRRRNRFLHRGFHCNGGMFV